jgi:maleate isomerase
LNLPCVAATAAFRALAVPRIALIHPPWFTEDTVQKGSAYFQEQGFQVVHAGHMTPARENTEVNPEETYEWVRRHVPSNADGVFIAGNGFRTIGVIAALEEDLGRPVLREPGGVLVRVAPGRQVFRKDLMGNRR